MKRITVLFENQLVADEVLSGDQVADYAAITTVMNTIEALYRAFYVHNTFDEWEDIKASRKLYEIEK